MIMSENISARRRAGVPLVGVGSVDPAGVVRACVMGLNGKADEFPIVQWDIIRGACGVNEVGSEWVNLVCEGQDPRMVTGNPAEFLGLLDRLPAGGLVVMLGASRLLSDPQSALPVCQGVWNLRDILKQGGSMLVLVGPIGWALPVELRDDVDMISEALPVDAELSDLTDSLISDAELPALSDDVKSKAVDAVAGLSSFASEQVLALSLSKEGLDLGKLWERKTAMIEQTPGLSVWRGGESFDDLGGLDNAKGFFSQVVTGPRAPRVVLFLDEIEKALAGSGGDSSGVSQGFLGTLLSWSQDTNAAGAILLGHPGSGKSALAKAVGSEAGCPTISFDLNGMKASLVGESEARLRGALSTVDAIGRGRVLVLATCNAMESLPPELKRRFGLATYFFDLPSAEERAAIWPIYLAKFGRDAAEALPSDEGWTGAEIARCVDTADRLGCSVVDAALYVVPVCRAAPERIESLRRYASGRFLNASGEGVYRFDKQAASVPGSGRKIDVN